MRNVHYETFSNDAWQQHQGWYTSKKNRRHFFCKVCREGWLIETANSHSLPNRVLKVVIRHGWPLEDSRINILFPLLFIFDEPVYDTSSIKLLNRDTLLL
jgi:hypothetical protein